MKESALLLLLCGPLLTTHAQEETVLRITATDAVHFVVTDPVGRKTGCDPRGAQRPSIVNGIPHSNYSFETIGDIPPPGDSASADVSLLFEFGPLSAENRGTYSLQLIGRRLGTYEMLSFLESGGNNGVTVKESTATGVIGVGQTVSYTFMLVAPFNQPIAFTKAVNTITIRQDLDNSFKLKLLGEQGFYKDLSNSLDSYEKHLSKKDTLKAVKEVEKFQDRITGEYNKGTKPNDKRFITADAWKILYDDAQYLVAHLIQLPPKPVGLTVLRQLDSLKAEVQRQQSKKNLSGTILVKGLLLSLDQAKKQLQQADSAKAAIAVRVFQLVVDETHELTNALLEKNKPLPSLYVKDEAYIQLHYRAKYILEALPEPRIDIQQHRLHMVDKELQKELDALKQMTEQK